MSNPVGAVASVVTTPVSWAKAKPWVFAIFLVLVILLAIRYSTKILALFGKVPVAGGRVVAFARPSSAPGA